MKNVILVLLIAIGSGLFTSSQATEKPNKSAVVKYENVRFTVLTPGLIRMEWDSAGMFTDQPSFVAVNRDLPVPQFTVTEDSRSIQIVTDKLVLNYQKSPGRLTGRNLEITVKASNPPVVWKPGRTNTGNLKGTARTLDERDGDIHWDTHKKLTLEDGILSRDGWTLLDDSKDFLFDNSDWPWVETRRDTTGQDWYFFGYGKDYKTALYDYSRIGGKIPMPPRFAFGYWWSKYWNYSDNELRELASNFHKYDIPFDVMVIDLDWHTTDGLNWFDIPYPGKVDEFGVPLGWVGYTWNKDLFPAPEKYLKWAHEQHIKTTVDLHTASGVRANEEKYAEFAKAVNFDTTGQKNVPYREADKLYMENFFKIILHPLEKMGLDFWWLDWQQWPYSKEVPGLNNTWWANYTFYTDMERQGKHRPLIYHRWGGLGNHRYQIGFSGDAAISWASLDYQPYFTATASNVLYGYWSHDIVGHKFNPTLPADTQKMNPELLTRWMQLGALSPIFRTHSSKDAKIIKEAWNYKPEYANVIHDAIHLRYTLAPYIYTMARKAYDTGISLCRPMYYDYPEKQEAYDFKNEYLFGDDMLVAPITSPMTNSFSTVKVWLPEGNDWYEVSTGTLLKGGQTLERKFLLSEYPLYVKAGTIVPMYPHIKNLQETVKSLIVRVYPGDSSYETRFYEDAGDDDNYKKGAYTFTTLKTDKQAHNTILSIMPRKGSFPGMLAARNMEVQFYGTVLPDKVSVNGKELPYSSEVADNSWTFTGKDFTVHVYLPQVQCDEKLTVQAHFPEKGCNVNGLITKMRRLKLATALLKDNWNDVSAIPSIISVSNQVDVRVGYWPEKLNQIVNEFNRDYLLIPNVISKTHVSKEVAEKCNHYLQE